MKQPKWKCVGLLGDVNAPEHGGALVLEDTTGVYPPELEVYEPDWEERLRKDDGTIAKDQYGDDKYLVRIYRIEVEKFVLVDGRLYLENEPKYAAEDPSRGMHQEWWVTRLDEILSFIDMDYADFAKLLLSPLPVQRASAYYHGPCAYFGCCEFDQHPLWMSNVEAQVRFRNKKGKFK